MSRRSSVVNLPSFSFGRKERSLSESIQEHLSIVSSCVGAFEKVVKGTANADASARHHADEVFRLESQADQIQRNLDVKIAEGAFFGGIREDILTLIEKVDSVADAAKDATRMLMMVADAGDEQPPEPSAAVLRILKDEHMELFLKSLIAAVARLGELIQGLRENKRIVLSRVQSVEECEEEADSQKNYLLTTLFRGPCEGRDAVTLIGLRDFLFVADNVADRAEDASDVVLILVAKGYG